MRRFRKMMLLALAVGLLVPLSPQASAQTPKAFEAQVVGTVETNTGLGTEHVRHEGAFSGTLSFRVTAVRDTGQTVDCEVDTNPDEPITYRARETLEQGRGFINPTTDAQQARGTNGCEIRVLGGNFHRVGTLAIVELGIDVTANNGFADDYCIRGELMATPLPPDFTRALIVGSVRSDPVDNDPPCGDAPGRTADDDTAPNNEHG